MRKVGYKNLKIPVCVIADLDLLRELDTFERVLRSLAPTDHADQAMTKCRSIIAQIKALGPIHSEAALNTKLQAIIDETFDWSITEQLNRIRRTLADLSGGLSQTARLKNQAESLRSHSVYHDLKAYLGEVPDLRSVPSA